METTLQLSLRLPESVVKRVETCVARIRKSSGLDVTRAEVIRMLIAHALETTGCDVTRMFPRAR